MRLPNVIQLQMPPWKPDKDNNWDVPVYGSEIELSTFRPWRDAEFTGTPVNDFINAASVEQAVNAMKADTSKASGVRIRFDQHATYSNLIGVLDLMNRLNQRIYWLDIRHQPTTFYAITRKAQMLPPCGGMVFCGGYSQTAEIKSNLFAFQQQLTDLL